MKYNKNHFLSVDLNVIIHLHHVKICYLRVDAVEKKLCSTVLRNNVIWDQLY